MPFSHHSHSGQFCGHAQNSLEEVVQTAVAKKMQVYALTEHMPREEKDLYPEEIKEGKTSRYLEELFDKYYHEALRLQKAYASQIKILIGVEIDWIRPSSKEYISNLLGKYAFELFVGSVHHVHTKPTDHEHTSYAAARDISGGTDERIFEDYFDLQYEMLRALKPPIVGHFDVIRLKADNPNGSFMQWEGVWHRILRNLEFIQRYGGVVEINSAAVRKGMDEPYPKAEICKVFLEMGGQFTLSDDSHGIDQVGTSYNRVLGFVEELGIKDLIYYEKGSITLDNRFPHISTTTVAVQHLKRIWSI